MLFGRALHSVLQGGGTVHQAHRVVEAMKEVSFDGAMTTVTYDDDKTTVDALIKVADGMGYPATQVQ